MLFYIALITLVSLILSSLFLLLSVNKEKKLFSAVAWVFIVIFGVSLPSLVYLSSVQLSNDLWQSHHSIEYSNGYREETYKAGKKDSLYCDTLQIMDIIDGKYTVSEEYCGKIVRYQRFNDDYFKCELISEDGIKHNITIESNYVNVINH